MADTTTDKPSAASTWVSKHKKSIIIAAILFGAVIVYMIAKHNAASNTASGTGAVNTNAANAAIPSVGQPYYGGGEFGGGYASANNYGQIEQQLASINSTLNSLAASPGSSSTSSSGSPTPTNPSPPVRSGPAISQVKNPGFNLNGMTITQAENLLAQQGGHYYISNVSYGGKNYSAGALPSSVANTKITSFTPYSSGGVRVN